MKRLDNLLAAAMCAFILFLFASTAAAGTIYVKWNSPSPDQGQSWDTAFHTVQAGVNAAVSSDEVRVAAGTYVESITLKDGIKLLGGYSGVGEERDRRAFVTVLDGDGQNVITAGNGITLSTVVDGFTITGGGNGIDCSNDSLTITNNTIQFCSCGVYCGGHANPQVISNNLSHNRAYGVYVNYYSSPLIANNTILGNQSGGVSIWQNSSPVILNNTIVGNGISGGVLWRAVSSPTMINNVIAFNCAGLTDYTHDGSPVYRNNCVFGNGTNYSDGLPPGDGDIPDDPRFASQAYGNMHILSDSPCIDAGDDSVVQPAWKDFEGQDRILGAHVDVGADESDGSSFPEGPYCFIKVSPDGSDSNDGLSWGSAKQTVQAGINAACLLGGEVWVKGGVYNECTTLHAFAYLYGGFSGSEAERSQRNWAANLTILDGQQAGSVVTIRAGWNMSAISGFTIRNGNGTAQSYQLTGGGIACRAVSLAISDNVITRNTNGPGVYCTSASLAIVNNNVVLNANGGVGLDSSSGPLVNNTITNNGGSGVSCSGSASTIANNIVALNTQGITSSESGDPTLSSNCVFGNAAYDYSDGLSHPTDINVDPKLADMAFGNVHIQPYSPCVDAGDDSFAAQITNDIDHQARIQGAHVDIGADESNGFTWPTGAAVVRVSPDGNDASDGSSWLLAKRTIGAAITAVESWGAEVWVRQGIYTESVALKPYVHLYGGFNGTETERSQRNWTLNKTVLEGNGAEKVVIAQGYSLASTLDGFVVQGGQIGIYCEYGSPIISNNTVTHNGQGILSDSGSPIISSNMIRDNLSSGIDCGPAVVTGNVIRNNGGTGVYGGLSAIQNNLITGNASGGVYVWNNAKVYNNTVVGNSAGAGGGVYLAGTAILRNNLIAFNTSGIATTSPMLTPVLEYNCVFGNGNQDYSAGLSPGAGSISEDPGLASTSYGNVHIQPGSPCIDAGDGSIVQADWRDVDGQDRIQGGGVDIGADEADGTEWAEGPYAVIRVSTSGSDDNDGSSWESAKKTIQAAIDVASQLGGDVWVKAGTYEESLTLKPFAHVYGGFAGTETSKEQRDWQTIISEVTGAVKGKGYRVCTIDGFHIDGRARFAIDCTYGASPTVSNNIIAPDYGPAISCNYSAAPLILNNLVTGNTNYPTPTIQVRQSSPTIAGNTISNGRMAIYCSQSAPVITGNRIVGNVSQAGTYGIYCISSSPIITNNLIANNATSYTGSAIKCWYGDTPVVVNNTVVGNTCLPQQVPSGAIDIASPNAIVRNNLVAFNTAGICCYQTPLAFENNDSFGNDSYQYDGFPTDPTGTDGNISLDPMFRDLAAGDYRLRWDSPCVDAGTNEGAPETDILGVLRPIDGNWDGLAVTDIGAYEYAPLPVTIDVIPGNNSNAIQLQPNRLITVAVLGNAEFDATSIDAKSVTFGPGNACEVHKQGHFQDANSDGFTDLVLHFRCGDTGILPGTSTVVLRGRLSDGERIEGSDWVKAKGFSNPGHSPR